MPLNIKDSLLLTVLLSLLHCYAAPAPPPLQHVFANSVLSSFASYRIPSLHESAVQGRRILNMSSIATFSSVFPGASSSAFENRPDDLGGAPIGLMEYYASCGSQPYNPTILAIGIATTIKNARAGSNVTLSLRYHPPANHPPSDDPYTYSPANLPRFSLIGHIEPLSARTIKEDNIAACFLTAHPDAELWTPGNDIHESLWARLVVNDIYWVGGFGDRAYIGWIPVTEWGGVTTEEVKDARLVGEEGWAHQAQQGNKSWNKVCAMDIDQRRGHLSKKRFLKSQCLTPETPPKIIKSRKRGIRAHGRKSPPGELVAPRA